MTDRFTMLPIAAAIIAVSALVAGTKAKAHDAPSGWRYGIECCSSIDCREVPASYVRETSAGYVLTKTGETLAYGDSRIKDSKDDGLHWCSMGGSDQGRTICLYVPPKSF